MKLANKTETTYKRTKVERFDWFIQRIQTRVAFGWLSERSGEKGAGSIFFLGLGLVSTLTLTLKQRSLKRRDLDSGPSTHIPLRSRGLLLGCSERANTR